MAPSAPMTSTQEQLLQSLLPKSITAGKSRKYREAFNRRIKHHNYGRTNQFEVFERLDGLEEKFQILNRDDLSDALRSRRAEIRGYETQGRFLPDVLDLLLRLSIDPANIKRSDHSISAKEQATELPPLRWADIEENDPINHNDPIWKNPDYSDLSSDEDILPSPDTAVINQTIKKLEGKATEGSVEHAGKVFKEQTFTESVDLSIYRGIGETKEEGLILITELEATKECLFMLQGLPTKLYSDNNSSYLVNTGYSLRNVNQEVFCKILRTFAHIGERVQSVRNWLKTVPTTQYARALQESVANVTSRFYADMAELQAHMLRSSGNAHIGLLPCLEAATRKLKDVQAVCEYCHLCKTRKADSIRQLEVLFDLICEKQAAGEVIDSAKLLDLFMPTVQVYLKPLMHWMKYGELHESLDSFFVAPSGQQKQHQNLWEGWFVLEGSRGNNRAPRFLEDFSQAIFAQGKTTLFLRCLGEQHSNVEQHAHSLVGQEDLENALSSDYLSFAEIFADNVRSMIKPVLSQTSARLYRLLDQQCGLWEVLDAFECIYFANHGPVTDSIEKIIFRRLDSCNNSWSDRFLLSELFENAFADVSALDTERLVIHSEISSRNLENRRKSVNILGDLSVNYGLPWQVANIIPQTCFASYRRISLLLMQLRRSRYSLERRAHFHVMNARLDSDIAEQNTSRALYQKLLLFANIMYNHFTSLVVESSTRLMKTRMQQASTVDEMTKVHTIYITDLEKACLTSKRLTPIRDTIISILDLSIRFADIVTTPGGKFLEDEDAKSFRSVASRPGRKMKQRDDEDSEDEEEESSSDNEGYSTFVVLDELSPIEEFRRMSKEFDRHLTFIIAGLKSLGRVDGEESWDILAGRLDWKRRSEY